MTPAVLHILLSLAAEDRHGLGIAADVKAFTHGRLTLGPGTLYGTIKRLLDAGLVEDLGSPSRRRPLDDSGRRSAPPLLPDHAERTPRAGARDRGARLGPWRREAAAEDVMSHGPHGASAADHAEHADAGAVRVAAACLSARVPRAVRAGDAGAVRRTRGGRGSHVAGPARVLARHPRRSPALRAARALPCLVMEDSHGRARLRHPAGVADGDARAAAHGVHRHPDDAQHRQHHRRLQHRQRRAPPAVSVCQSRSARDGVGAPQRGEPAQHRRRATSSRSGRRAADRSSAWPRSRSIASTT